MSSNHKNNNNQHPDPYELHRSDNLEVAASEPTTEISDPVLEHFDHNTFGDDYDGESYTMQTGSSSILTASPYPYRDATQSVVEMHLALLYLLSNPEEFQNAIQYTGGHSHHYSLSEWNETNTDCGASTVISTVGGGADTTTTSTIGDDDGGSVGTNHTNAPPLPFVVFCDDAEVVLPQAHTASQLFGIERMEGIELESAAGIHNLSVLFLRWLALMPGGDHLNIIDPPGLTVMRIAGGRYRVTAAHRVVWTWMNEFANLEAVAEEYNYDNASMDTEQQQQQQSEQQPLQVGDLVTMTIVDVFETDNNGRLLSYCPTFDNRRVQKTTAHVETIRKSSSQFKKTLIGLSQSTASKRMQALASQGLEAGLSTARTVASRLQSSASPTKSQVSTSTSHTKLDAQGFEQALTEAEEATTVKTTTKEEEEEEEAVVAVEKDTNSTNEVTTPTKSKAEEQSI